MTLLYCSSVGLSEANFSWTDADDTFRWTVYYE